MSTEDHRGKGAVAGPFPYKEAGYPKPFGTVSEFGETYGLVDPLIPHGHRGDTFSDFRAVREFVDDLYVNLGSFTIRKLRRDTGLGAGNHLIIDYLLALGSWRLKDRVYSGKERFTNPEYVHDHTLAHIADADRRREHAETVAQFGFPTSDALSTAWGIDYPRDYTLRSLDGFDWGDATVQGKKNVTRTIILAAEWLDRSKPSLCDDLGIAASTFREWRGRYELHGFADEVPPDPVDVYGIWPK